MIVFRWPRVQFAGLTFPLFFLSLVFLSIQTSGSLSQQNLSGVLSSQNAPGFLSSQIPLAFYPHTTPALYSYRNLVYPYKTLVYPYKTLVFPLCKKRFLTHTEVGLLSLAEWQIWSRQNSGLSAVRYWHFLYSSANRTSTSPRTGLHVCTKIIMHSFTSWSSLSVARPWSRSQRLERFTRQSVSLSIHF